MSYSGRTLVRAVQRGTDWSKGIPRQQPPHMGRMDSINALLAKPTWSVSSLLPNQQPPESSETSTTTQQTDTAHAAPPPASTSNAEDEITPAKLHHLLRLSALPLPTSAASEARLLADLRAQVHFVKHLQSVDTNGVQPLVSIRDETATARAEQTIGLAQLSPWLEREEKVGKKGTVRRRKTDVAAAEREKKLRVEEAVEAGRFAGVEKFLWEDLEPSGGEEGRRWGGHYVVKRGKKTQADGG